MADDPHPQYFRSRRVELELPVELRFDGTGGRIVEGVTVNVSETGIVVRLEEEVEHPEGTGLRFDVLRRYGGRGELAWCRRSEEGDVMVGLDLRRSRYDLIEILEKYGH